MEKSNPIDTVSEDAVKEGIARGVVADAGDLLMLICHSTSFNSGWWRAPDGSDRRTTDPRERLREILGRDRAGFDVQMSSDTIEAIVAAFDLKEENYSTPEKLMLNVSELSEGMEGFRKSKMDDHLEAYPMLAVELGDSIIRSLDLAGAKGYPIGRIIAEKLAFNMRRPDHKLEVRNAAGGKQF